MEDSQASAPPQPPAEKSAVEMLLDRRRVAFVAIVLVAELALFVLTIVVPTDPGLRQQLVTQGEGALPPLNTTAGPLVGLIVANNLRVALLEMIPFVGFVFLPFSIFVSGVVIQGLAIEKSVSPTVVAFSYLLLPFTFVELLAYAIAFVSGTMVLVAWRKKRLRREARVFALEIVTVAAVVIVAAIMETVTIFNPIAGLLLWLPLSGGVVAVLLRVVRT
jgi:hypothetical protein